MAYFLNLFSPETWNAFRASGCKVSGFSRHQKTQAERSIEPGGTFLCYLVGLGRWIARTRRPHPPAETARRGLRRVTRVPYAATAGRIAPPQEAREPPRGPAGPRSPCGPHGLPSGTRVRRVKAPARIGSTLSRIGGAHAAEAATRQLSSRQPHEAAVGRNGTRAVDLPERPAPTRPPVRAPVPATLGVGSKRPVRAAAGAS